MRRGLHHAVRLALLLAAAAPVLSAAPPPRLKVAQDLARAHAAWPQGRAWVEANKQKAGELVMPVLNRCVPDVEDAEITAFSVYLRLSRAGRILEAVTDVDASLGQCLSREGRELRLPETPREDFWVQLNLAAGL